MRSIWRLKLLRSARGRDFALGEPCRTAMKLAASNPESLGAIKAALEQACGSRFVRL